MKIPTGARRTQHFSALPPSARTPEPDFVRRERQRQASRAEYYRSWNERMSRALDNSPVHARTFSGARIFSGARRHAFGAPAAAHEGVSL